MRRSYKISLISVVAVVALVTTLCLVFLLPDKMKATGDALTRLRSLMTGTALGFEPLTAYIIPSDDSHQVSSITRRES